MGFKFQRFILVLILTSLSVTAAHAANTCWQSEENPFTKTPYTSIQEWNHDVEYWQLKKPAMAHPISLIRAYNVYRAEQKAALGFKNDKETHCFYGCRISQTVDYRTAEYVAWLKEDRDLKDCKLSTHFELADFEATLKGADLGGRLNSREECAASCSKEF